MKKIYTIIGMASMLISSSASAQYCTPPDDGYGAGTAGFPFTGITLVSLGTLSNTSVYDNDYIHYSAVAAPDIPVNSNQTLRISYQDQQVVSGTGINVAAWIDYNGDGDFDDAGEDVALFTYTGTASGTEDIQIAIPAGATLGTTRLRVYTDMTENGGHNAPEPCGYLNNPYPGQHSVGQHGEVEDYDINLVAELGSSITENTGISNLTIFPNPAVDKCNVQFNLKQSGTTTIRLMNIIGEKVLEKSENSAAGLNTVSLETATLEKGIYLISIVTSEGIVTKELAIQ